MTKEKIVWKSIRFLVVYAAFILAATQFLKGINDDSLSPVFLILSFLLFMVGGIFLVIALLVAMYGKKSFVDSLKSKLPKQIEERVAEYEPRKEREAVFRSSERKRNEIFIANKGLNKFHRSTCRIGQTIKHGKRIYFRNVEEASGHGFQPCKNCNPHVENE